MAISKPKPNPTTSKQAARPKDAPPETTRRPSLAPTGLSQYLSLDNCDRYLRFYLHKGETDRLVQKYSKAGLRQSLQPIGPLLVELGDRIENQVIDGLKAHGHNVQDLTNLPLEATLAAMKAATSTPVYLYQAAVGANLGRWPFEGRADLLQVQRDGVGQLKVMVADVKSTRKDKVQHRLQVAIYVKMLHEMLGDQFGPVEYSGIIVRRNPDGTLQDPDTATRFELVPYLDALDQLIFDPESALERVDSRPPEELHYYFNQKCDGCFYNPVCMVESAERGDIALVPFLESADKRALAEQGIKTVRQLAGLKALPVLPNRDEPNAAPVERRLTTPPDQADTVQALSEKWPLAPRLDRLIQRAARVMRRLTPDNAPPSYSYFFDSARSTLPDEKKYPDLVKIFLDVQTDYLEDRLYLVGARVVGPNGSRNVVHMTAGVPDDEAERKLLTDWITEIFGAVYTVARDINATPVHLYLYNRHDQKALLDGLRRHLDVFAGVPALYDLLTATPALTQSAVSFLYDEVKERVNLSSTGHTLQTVATQLGFKWIDYAQLFRQGMFDYSWRREDGLRVEAAARFYSSIPLEYAYGAWRKFKAEDFQPVKRPAIAAYLKVTPQQIKDFQGWRLEALAHIENNFKFKNSYLDKFPLDLASLQSSAAAPKLNRVLEEFLFMEHYAKLQEHLELFGQTVAHRVQQGRALLARCTYVYDNEERGRLVTMAHFEIVGDAIGLDEEAVLRLNKLKRGEFVVLNPLEKDGRPWDIVRGRLSRMFALEGPTLSLALMDMTLPGGSNKKDRPVFRYYHDTKLRPEVGQLYTLDEMVDDLNGDRLLEACRNADTNAFYQTLTAPDPLASNQRTVAAENITAAQNFLQTVAQLEGTNAPTAAQQAAIAGHYDERAFLVQGPPGTGKSHTLGWAALARMVASGGNLRIAVSCQTHNAVNIVLQSIADKWARLKSTPIWPQLEHLRLFKVGDEDDGNTVSGIEPLDPWEKRNYLAQILGGGLTVIGGTPGGLYKLMRERTKAGRSTGNDPLWREKPFDLVILDEASQMNLPQAVLATSWLKPDGQLIVVGDHRQMSPILTHNWDDEERRSSQTLQPYRSVFQFLVDQNFPRVALDESFRLHRVQADFLHHNIYKQDGIVFHSRRQTMLAEIADPDLSPFVRAVLDPRYPVVVVQHFESVSQQANPTEAAIVAPIIEACTEWLDLDGDTGIGVVVPHRAQKAMLREMFPLLAVSGAIDTVERFQGDEREVIIVSATASDPDYVLAEAEFLLNPNRLNVALSRPRRKLIVVASNSVFSFLSSNLEVFEQAMLWKRVLSQCEGQPLWAGDLAGTKVKVYGRKDEG